jgi:sugar lactone lactonase YvrE
LRRARSATRDHFVARAVQLDMKDNTWPALLLGALVALLPRADAQAKASLRLPAVLDLPPGFAPEGIAHGRGQRLFVSSIKDGAIYALDARTGTGSFFVTASSPPRQALGMRFDPRSNYLFAAGGNSGGVRIYDGDTANLVADIRLGNAQPTFVNDLVITDHAVYLTESTRPALYRLPLTCDGRLADSGPREIALGGEFQFLPGKLNANGIVAQPDGQELFIVHTTSGALYRVNPQTGFATAVSVAGGPLQNGDGLVLRGRQLYVVQNLFNQVAVLDLSPHGDTATVLRTITDPNLDIPTTATELGHALYAVNARYTTRPTPTTTYSVVRLQP